VRFRVKPDAPASTVIPVRINGLTLTGAYGQNFDWYGDVALEDGGVTVAAPQQATLNLSVVGHGTVSPGAGAHKYDIGSQVTLTAAAAASDIYTTLARWEGDVTGTANPITVTMDSDKDVTAVFSTQSGGGGTQATFAGIAFRWCPAGTFTMGSPTLEVGRNTDEVEHQVTLTKGFWMSETEVTQAQWVAVMGSNPSYFTGDTSRPVEQVSWDDICTATTGYLAKLNAANPGNGFRLPTEAEWEYAYRAGTTQRFYWGDDPSYTLIGNYAWYSNNSSNTTHSVGTKTANAWGLKDMSGNVWEWCADWYGSYASGAVTDPTGLGTGSIRVVRGGGCYYNDNCRAADRGSGDPGSTYVDIGLRLAR
jgi:formylglycine-generating enzyme required for sulfatase activity